MAVRLGAPYAVAAYAFVAHSLIARRWAEVCQAFATAILSRGWEVSLARI